MDPYGSSMGEEGFCCVCQGGKGGALLSLLDVVTLEPPNTLTLSFKPEAPKPKPNNPNPQA